MLTGHIIIIIVVCIFLHVLNRYRLLIICINTIEETHTIPYIPRSQQNPVRLRTIELNHTYGHYLILILCNR